MPSMMHCYWWRRWIRWQKHTWQYKFRVNVCLNRLSVVECTMPKLSDTARGECFQTVTREYWLKWWTVNTPHEGVDQILVQHVLELQLPQGASALLSIPDSIIKTKYGLDNEKFNHFNVPDTMQKKLKINYQDLCSFVAALMSTALNWFSRHLQLQ